MHGHGPAFNYDLCGHAVSAVLYTVRSRAVNEL